MPTTAMSAPKDSVAASPGPDVVASPGLDVVSMSGDAEAGGEKATEAAPEIVDLYRPLPVAADAPEEGNPLTVRAVIVGIILGSLVNASNIYLGLKTGFLFGASMFGAVFGFGIISLMTKIFPKVPFLGGPFGPKENVIVQATTAGAGGLGGLFTAGLPAMYQLDLLSNDPRQDLGRILTLTLICSFFGLCLAVPLRKFFIVNMSRDLGLIFPTPTATALTIQSMHAATSEAVDAIKRVKVLAYTFIAAFVQRVASYYALGLLYDWHVFTWIYIWGNYSNAAIQAESWGWMIEWTPAFFGSGMLVGLNTAISLFSGTLFAWGILGPILVHYGICQGHQVAPEDGDVRWQDYMTYFSLRDVQDPNSPPSPRYWFLWPGVAVLVCCSVAELLVHWKIFYRGIRYAWENLKSKDFMKSKGGRSRLYLQNQPSRRSMFSESIFPEDPSPEEDQVPPWMWGVGALAMIIVACIISEVQFEVNAGLAILASILAICFAFLGIHAAGVTDIAPLTASANANQLVFGGITSGQGYPVKQAQMINLVAANIASGAAEMSQELTSDFRTGFLLNTPPKKQFYAQAIGAVAAMFLAPGIFILFSMAYPCIIEGSDRCTFSAPTVAAWRAVAEAVTEPNFSVPVSSGIFSCVLGAVAIVQVVVKRTLLVGDREPYRAYLPNWMAVGVAFTLPQTVYSTASLMGATIGYVWMKKRRANYDVYMYAVAAGLIAGEGLGGVIGAALQLGGVGGDIYGTQVGCPRNWCWDT